jgi:hypothetical protein
MRGTRQRQLGLELLEPREVPAVVFVSTGADAGPGSLRAALDAASASTAIDTIVIRNNVGTVTLAGTLEYTGPQALKIRGNDATIQPAAGQEGSFDLFESTGGADLTLEGLAFQNGLKNLDIIVPAGATGELAVILKRVAIRNSIQHGLHIDDLTNATAASVRLAVQDSIISGNGTDPNDFDGIRVDERGAGGITATFRNSTVADNGNDGVELDERDAGDVVADIRHSDFLRNGFANVADLEDGFDIDEGGSGNIVATAINARFLDNFEGGFDVNEDDGDDPTDAGDLIATLINVEGNDNDDKGLDFSEGDGGHIIAAFVNVAANRNGIFAGNLEEGIVLEEEGGGDVVAAFVNVTASGNGDDGIDIDETGDGDFVGLLVNVRANDNGAEGIDIDEADAGGFFIFLNNIDSNDPLDVSD